jgi:hypothetical protein
MMFMKTSLAVLMVVFAFNANARDDKLMFPVKAAIERGISEGIIDGSVKFYFGDTKHSKVKSEFGEIKTNKKTNAFNKSDLEACQWAFLSAIKAFHQKAKKLGANAVINIQSNYKNNPVKNDTQFQCGAGSWVAGVALKGNFVSL